MEYLGIGWDVGGWCGSKQAVALVRWVAGETALEWLGISPPFALSRRVPLALDNLLAPACTNATRGELAAWLQAPRIAIAIDAPLAFPRAFTSLLRGQPSQLCVPEGELANPYAYRDCERWLHQQYGKKPLSASFDKLGNNATLALSLAHQLQALGYQLVPQQQADSTRALFEAYPALMKQGYRSQAPAQEYFQPLLPPQLAAGSDSYDAALCALMALAFAAHGASSLLPELVPPPADMQPDEGWIYHFRPEKQAPPQR